MNKTPEKYKSIWAWGRMMGSFPYYMRDQVEIAKRDNAPAGAIYKDQDGTWHTLADVTSVSTRWYFEQQHPELFEKYMQKEVA